ncbi:hypothetical protein AAG570_000042 [Ranatra chinensis]|uniref:Uncharacterized protein n=1 Tax=Ranatra chinensis TaxID=642074 RepID=A0ABD0YW69_9HEMI
MPESPYWSVSRGDVKGAERSLAWLRDKGADIEQEIGNINSFIIQQRKKKLSVKKIVTDRATIKAFVIVSVLSIFQSSIGACVSMLLAAVWFFYHYDDKKKGDDNLPLQWAPFACFVVYGASYSIGIGPIVTAIKGEIFPGHVKGLASGVTTIVLAVSSFIVNKIYQPLDDGPGMYINYIIYCVVSFLTIVFTLTFVIETKGKSLQDIQTKLNRKKEKKPATIDDLYNNLERQ